MPEFWFGMILLIVFSIGVSAAARDLPRRRADPRRAWTRAVPAGWLDVAWHLVLPVITLTLVYLAEYSLVMRASLIDEIGQDYLTTARAKGLTRRRGAPPARGAQRLLPTITLIFLNLGFVVGGAITIEYVFSHGRAWAR